MDYITIMLVYNEKRCKMRVDERTIAGDGFMLNLLSALQELSVKVIDGIFTIFHYILSVYLYKLIIIRSNWIK